jgi:hypothetical protein
MLDGYCHAQAAGQTDLGLYLAVLAWTGGRSRRRWQPFSQLKGRWRLRFPLSEDQSSFIPAFNPRTEIPAFPGRVVNHQQAVVNIRSCQAVSAGPVPS